MSFCMSVCMSPFFTIMHKLCTKSAQNLHRLHPFKLCSCVGFQIQSISMKRSCLHVFLYVCMYVSFFFTILHKLCTNSAQNLHKICTNSAQTLHKICTKSTQNLYKICTKTSQNLHKLCTDSAQTLMRSSFSRGHLDSKYTLGKF